MVDKFENGIDPDPDNHAAEVASIEAAANAPTEILIKVVFKKNWGGAGNVLNIIGRLQEMVATDSVELESAEWQEDLL